MLRPPPPSLSPRSFVRRMSKPLYSTVTFCTQLQQEAVHHRGFRIAKERAEFVLETSLLFTAASRVLIGGRVLCSCPNLTELEHFFAFEVGPLVEALDGIMGQERMQKLLVFNAYWIAYGEYAGIALGWDMCDEGHQASLDAWCIRLLDTLVWKRHGLIEADNETHCPACRTEIAGLVAHVCESPSFQCVMCELVAFDSYGPLVKHFCGCRSKILTSLGDGFDLIGHDIVRLLLTHYLEAEDLKRLAQCNSAWAGKVHRFFKRCRCCGYVHRANIDFIFHSGRFNTISYAAVMEQSAFYKMEGVRTRLHENWELVILGSFALMPVLLATGGMALFPLAVLAIYGSVVGLLSRRPPQEELQQLPPDDPARYRRKKDTWTCCKGEFASLPCSVCRSDIAPDGGGGGGGDAGAGNFGQGQGAS